MSTLIGIVSGVLALVFVVAGVAKLVDRGSTRTSMQELGLPAATVPAASWLLPAVELAVAALIIVDQTRRAGALIALALLSVFSVVLARTLKAGRQVRCNCFGSSSAQPVRPSSLIRNLVLGLGAATVAASPGDVVLTGWVADLDPAGRRLLAVAVPALTTVVALSVVVRHLLAEHRRLATSVRLVEELFDRTDGRREVTRPPEPEPGLPIGLVAPHFELPDHDRRLITPAMLVTDGGPAVVVFVSGGCGACDALMPELDRLARRHRRLALVTVVAGTGAASERLLRRHDGVITLADANGATALRYQAQWSPAAIVVGGDGRIATRPAYGSDAIVRLIERAADTPALRDGHVIPSESNRSLLGSAAPMLARLAGALGNGPAMIVFWDDSCQHCQRLAPELRHIEDTAPDGLPRFILVARQPPSTRFASPVVIDAEGSVTQAFGVLGTPSAVLLDGDRRVVSEVAAGTPMIRLLLGLDRDVVVPVMLPDPVVPARS